MAKKVKNRRMIGEMRRGQWEKMNRRGIRVIKKKGKGGNGKSYEEKGKRREGQGRDRDGKEGIEMVEREKDMKTSKVTRNEVK